MVGWACRVTAVVPVSRWMGCTSKFDAAVPGFKGAPIARCTASSRQAQGDCKRRQSAEIRWTCPECLMLAQDEGG